MQSPLRTPRLPALLALALLAACGGGDDASKTGAAPPPPGGYHTYGGGPPGGVVVALLDGEPDELDPVTYTSSPADNAIHLMFRSLARRDSTLFHFAPDLARAWELRPDSTLVLHLRNDAKWHDGQRVTAEDVVFTIERQKDPKTASPRQVDVAAVKSATATDSFTVEVKLSRVGPYVVNSLLQVVPVPKHLLGKVAPEAMRLDPFGRKPVGNGFYRFGRWDAGQSLILEANPDMPEGRAALDRIVMRFVPDMNAAMTELLAGQGDLLKISPDQKERVKSSQDVTLVPGPRVRPAWIAWNTKKAPMNDVQVRRAILMSVDRDKLAKGLFGDAGEPALSPFPSRLWEHSPDVKPIPYDPAGAQRLLAAAGWRDTNGDKVLDKNGQPLRVEVDYFPTEQWRQDVLVVMQDMLKQVGIQLQPRPFERTAWVDRLRRQEFQGSLWGWGWAPGAVGSNAEGLFHTRAIPPNGTNFASYSNPRVDALLDSAQVASDTTRGRQIWRQIETQVIDDAVYAPLFLDPELYGVNKRFKNVKFRGIEWWEDVTYWYIPENQRLPRDRTTQ
jgi:peptide/nickel transport system substrate-binding protein